MNKEAPEKYYDMRQWIDLVEKMGELTRVSQADLHLEIGGLTEMNAKRSRPPAFLFEDIKGCMPGARILTGSLLTPQRLALCLRLPMVKNNDELVGHLRKMMHRWYADSADYPYEVVPDGPVMQNVLEGEQVDITQIPAPLWHEHDGGRYVGTGCAVVTRDPDTGEINVGTYRAMVHDSRHVTIHIMPGKHGAIHMEKYHSQGKSCPMAISLGHDPLVLMMAGLEVPTGMCEYDLIGAIMGEKLKVVEAPLTGLPVPATSEIVIEGQCLHDSFAKEGPFGEFTGYYAGGESTDPLLRIDSVMYRNDPVVLGAPPGKPPHDYNYMKCVMRSAQLIDSLVSAGIPDVQSAWAHEVGGARFLLVVAIKQRYLGHARQAAYVASQCQVGAYCGRYVIVVDEDIDPSDLQDVAWALCTRSDPANDIEFIRRAWSSQVDPLLREGEPTYNSRAIIDACKPYEWIDEFPKTVQSSPEFRKSLKDKWGEILGF